MPVMIYFNGSSTKRQYALPALLEKCHKKRRHLDKMSVILGIAGTFEEIPQKILVAFR
jgi:hypothetical protein